MLNSFSKLKKKSFCLRLGRSALVCYFPFVAVSGRVFLRLSSISQIFLMLSMHFALVDYFGSLESVEAVIALTIWSDFLFLSVLTLRSVAF